MQPIAQATACVKHIAIHGTNTRPSRAEARRRMRPIPQSLACVKRAAMRETYGWPMPWLASCPADGRAKKGGGCHAEASPGPGRAGMV